VEWPGSIDELIDVQEALAVARPPRWKGDRGWGGAALVSADGGLATARAGGVAGAGYEAGLLALREGPLLAAAIRGLASLPEVLLVNATGRDHPRRAGLALHLGALLGVPTVGITHRPLLAAGELPEPLRGERTPLLLGGELVGHWLCTRRGTRPLAVHAAWRTDPRVAVEVALSASTGKARTPEPLRQARRLARTARTAAERVDRRLRVVRDQEPRVLRQAGIEITSAPAERPPFAVEAVAVEDDTYLVLGADPAFREPSEHLLEVLTAAHAAEPLTPGTVLVRPGRPLRFHAVVHDLGRDPTWTEEWIETALRELLETADGRGLRALGLEPLGCRHGNLLLDRFLILLERAIRAAPRRNLRRIWLVVS
jgi:deoxyribonuclease V